MTAPAAMDTAQPLVSVIIPTFNGSRFLAESIESALGQTYPRVEVIVVDDGSTDDTSRVAMQYEDRIKYIAQKNAGTAAARNTGIRHASGELIALLDHDDRWLPHKLERQVPRSLTNAKVGLVHTGARWFLSEDGRTTSEVLPRESMDLHDLLAWCRVCCATTLFSKSVIDEVGGFDESLLGTDDWDMWIRIAGAGYEVIGCREVLAEIRLHGTNQGSDPERTFRQALAVVDKPRALHADCVVCQGALQEARKEIHREFYEKMAAQSRSLWRNKQYARSLGARTRGIRRCPAVMLPLLKRLLFGSPVR